MDQLHPNHQLQILKAEHAQYQTGYYTPTARLNFTPIRAIIRSLTRPQGQ